MKRIISGHFAQETNRYAKGLTTLEIFQHRQAWLGEEKLKNAYCGTRTSLGGFQDFFKDKCDYELITPFAFSASPGPVVSQDVWQLVLDQLLDTISAQPKVDGILLSLHGAMVTEKYEDAEGELLERVRTAVGKDVPIVVTLDLHVNMTQKMVDNADALFPCDCYPHTDFYETGLRAASCIFDTLEGRIHPVMAWNKLDLILPYMPTIEPVFVPLLAKAQAFRDRGKLINVGICHGFFASDIYEQGAAVVAIADGDAKLAANTADALAEEIFALRKDLNRTYFTAQEAVKLAMESEVFPVVLADVNDNPGSGSSTDAPLLLQTLIDMKAKDVAVAVMYDPETVEQAIAAGVGATISVELGGKTVPEITGGPIHCDAYVKAITDGRFKNKGPMGRGDIAAFGNCVLLLIDDILVIVCSYHTQPYDLEIFRHIGIQPEEMKILMVKSAAHFRADYSTVAKKILDVETPAESPQKPTQMPLAHSRRPIYPLDDI